MSDNFPEKNIADKLTQLADAFRGITPGSIRFPENYPGKRIADKIDELIVTVREGFVAGNKEDLLTTIKDTLVGAINEVFEAITTETAIRESYDQEQDAKLQALNGHYYPLDGYDFGKSLDIKTPNPDDVALLTTYAMTMEGVSDPSGIIEDTVIKNEYDGVEFVWNAEIQAWTDWGIGNIVTASNEHLGVVKGNSQTGDGNISVEPDGSLKAVDYHNLWNNIIDLKNIVGDIDSALDLINGESV